MAATNWTAMWGAYAPAAEAWQAFMLNASMMWMMVPLNIGQKAQSQSNEERGEPRLRSLVQHTVDTHEQAQDFASRAYASSLEAGYRNFRAFEAATLDRGTYDGGIGLPTEFPRRAAA